MQEIFMFLNRQNLYGTKSASRQCEAKVRVAAATCGQFPSLHRNAECSR